MPRSRAHQKWRRARESSRTRRSTATRRQPGRWPPESLRVPHRPLPHPASSPPKRRRAPLRGRLGGPGGGHPRQSARRRRRPRGSSLCAPAPAARAAPAPRSAPGAAERRVVPREGEVLCRESSGRGWMGPRAPCARRAPARSPGSEVSLGVRGASGRGAPGAGPAHPPPWARRADGRSVRRRRRRRRLITSKLCGSSSGFREGFCSGT